MEMEKLGNMADIITMGKMTEIPENMKIVTILKMQKV